MSLENPARTTPERLRWSATLNANFLWILEVEWSCLVITTISMSLSYACIKTGEENDRYYSPARKPQSNLTTSEKLDRAQRLRRHSASYYLFQSVVKGAADDSLSGRWPDVGSKVNDLLVESTE